MASPRESQPANSQAERYEAEQQATQRTVVPAQRARQAVTGHNARYVLGFGLAGIVIAFAVIYVIYFA